MFHQMNVKCKCDVIYMRFNKIERKKKKMNGMKLLVLNLEKVSLQEQKVPVSYNSKLDLVNVGNHGR